MSLGKKVFSGAVLLFIRKIWGNVINLGVMIFLARVLSKEDFGLLAISSVFLGIINSLATSGIAEYVVYYDGEDKNQKLNAAFWLNLFLTLGVVIVVITTGQWWANFYHNDKIFGLLLLLLVPFFFEMNCTIPKALLRKELDYKTLVYYSSVSMTVVSIGKLLAAFSGFGVFSLTLPQAIVSPILMVAFYFKTKWRPFPSIGKNHFNSIFNYTRHIIGGRVLTRLVNEGDNLIVGKFVGLEGLGVYALAFQLANLVTTNVVFIVNDMFLPLFSKVKGDLERLRVIYFKMIQFLSFVSFPLITALAISAEPIVYFIYGEKWIDVVLPFQILCVFALGRSLSSPSSALFSAVGRPDIGFKFTLWFTPFFLLAVWLGSYHGIVGVAISTTLIRFLGSIISLYLSLGLIQSKLSELYQMIKGNLMSTLILLLSFSWALNQTNDLWRMLLLLLIPINIYLHLLIQRFFFSVKFIVFASEVERYLKVGFIVFQRIFFLKY